MTLPEIRQEIDGIDDQIRDLIVRRIALAGEVAELKRNGKMPVQDTAREREIISRLTLDLDDTLAGYVKILYTTILDLSRAHQSSLLSEGSKVADNIRAALAGTPELFPKSAVVACQGAEGANSTAACEKLFARPSVMYFNSFDGVCAAVDKGLCRYGVLPVENSLNGSVTAIYDLMRKYRFYIAQSVRVKVNFALLTKPGAKKINTIYSHEQALAQCSEYLQTTGAKIVPCENTAVAAKLVAESDRDDVAAVSRAECAELYNLEVRDENIQNNGNNYTRFLCISKSLEIYPGARKLSLMITLPHKPGALYHAMAKFSALGINLTKLESRPLPDRDFEFMFYFELDIPVYDSAVYNLFAQLENGSERFEFLGCYSEL